LTISFPI